MIRAFENQQPIVAQSAFIDNSAVVIGNVTIGAGSSVWPTAVIRGDIHAINIGENTSIQDGTVIHVTHAGPFNPEGFSTTIGSGVTVGHRVILHGCVVHDQCLVGMGSTIMDGAVIQSQVLLGANSLVPPGRVLESGFLWVGSPVKKIRPLKQQELEFIEYSANYYKNLAEKHRS